MTRQARAVGFRKGLGSLALVVLAGVMATGCSRKSGADPVQSFETDFLTVLFEQRPTLASSRGVHQYDGRLEDFSELGISQYTAALQAYRARLQTVLAQTRSPEALAYARWAQAWIDDQLQQFGETAIWRSRPELYLLGPMAALSRLRYCTHAVPRERLGGAVSILSEMPAMLAALRGNLTSLSEPRRQYAQALIGVFLQTLDADLASWAKEAGGVDVELLEQFRAASAVTQRALRETQDWLQRQPPGSAEAERAGQQELTSWLRRMSGLEWTYDQYRSWASARFEQSRTSFLQLAAPAGQSLAEAVRDLLKDPLEPREQLSQAAAALARLQQFLEAHDVLPDRLAVQPLYQQASLLALHSATTLCVYPGPLAPREVPPVWLTVPSGNGLAVHSIPWAVTRDGVELRVIGELLPGRYYLERELARSPWRIAKALPCPVTTAGWSAYVVTRLLEAGYGSQSKRLSLLAAFLQMLDDARWLAALEYHGRGQPLPAVVSWFEQNVGLPPAAAQEEARRVALDYSVAGAGLGRALMDQARERYLQGGRRTLKDFHRVFLDHAALPVGLLEGLLESTRESR